MDEWHGGQRNWEFEIARKTFNSGLDRSGDFLWHLYGAAEGDRILRRHSAVPQLGLSWGSVTCCGEFGKSSGGLPINTCSSGSSGSSQGPRLHHNPVFVKHAWSFLNKWSFFPAILWLGHLRVIHLISASPFMAKFYNIIELYKLVLTGRLTTVERAIRNDILRGKISMCTVPFPTLSAQ